MVRATNLETPLLRVSRPVAACSRCRAAKIKCDGKLPACTACEKTGRENECSSSNDQFAKGKERSYVAALESRIEKLEKRLAYAQLRKASVTMHENDEPDDPAQRKDSLATIRAAIRGKAARRREATDVDQLVSDFGKMSVIATTRDFETSTTNMTFARLILAATINEPIPRPRTTNLPTRPAAMALIQYYIDSIYSLFPAFPETSLFNALDAVYRVDGLAVADFEYWLMYMVLAIGSMSQSRSKADSYYKDGVTWVAHALKYADKVLVPGYVTQMQALILLVQYSMLDPTHFDSWQLIGFACRALVDLGFHQDPPKEQQADKKFLDLRRKIFYCLYSLDRSISMVHARPFSFTDDATSVALPVLPATVPPVALEGPLSGPHSLHSAMLLFQLRRIQSNWYQDLFQSSRDPFQDEQSSAYIWRMCLEMRAWSETFPKTLPAAIKDIFELELLYSYIYCLAPSCRVPAVSELGKSLIFEYSIEYVERIFAICRDPINTAFYTYHDALRVYFIGSQFMAVLSDSPDQLLDGLVPYTSAITGSLPPPEVPNIGRGDNIERSITCINRIIETLRTYGERWDDSNALKGTSETQATPLLADLQQRLRERNITSINSAIESGRRQLYPEQVEMRLSNDWANLDDSFTVETAQQGVIHPTAQSYTPQSLSYQDYPHQT